MTGGSAELGNVGGREQTHVIPRERPVCRSQPFSQATGCVLVTFRHFPCCLHAPGGRGLGGQHSACSEHLSQQPLFQNTKHHSLCLSSTERMLTKPHPRSDVGWAQGTWPGWPSWGPTPRGGPLASEDNTIATELACPSTCVVLQRETTSKAERPVLTPGCTASATSLNLTAHPEVRAPRAV